MAEVDRKGLTDEEILKLAGQIMGRVGGKSTSEAKTARNPAVKERLALATAAAAKANLKELDQIPCCGKDPHNKSCPRLKAMRRRGLV